MGIGARNYRVGDGWAPDTIELRARLRTFHELGGRLIDTSPNYGASETIVGELEEFVDALPAAPRRGRR